MATMVNIRNGYFNTAKYYLKSIAEQQHWARSARCAYVRSKWRWLRLSSTTDAILMGDRTPHTTSEPQEHYDQHIGRFKNAPLAVSTRRKPSSSTLSIGHTVQGFWRDRTNSSYLESPSALLWPLQPNPILQFIDPLERLPQLFVLFVPRTRSPARSPVQQQHVSLVASLGTPIFRPRLAC
jgi:hypothetical protein